MKELKARMKIVENSEKDKIENIIKKFEEVSDIDELEKISQESFQLEKKYVPEFNKEIAKSIKCDTLIMTVGHRKQPIILSILCLKPNKKIILLPSKETRKIAEEVFNDHHVKNLSIEKYIFEIDEVDASENYRIIKEKVLPAAKEGSIIIDPTGGRKIMVSSLSLVSFYHRFPMVYLYTKEKNGVVFPFTQTLTLIKNPFEFFGDLELKTIEEQFNSHFYRAAVKTCEAVIETIRDPATSKKLELIKELIEIYDEWDLFKHSSVPQIILSEKLKKVKEKIVKFGLNSILPENIDNNIKFLEEIEKRWKNKLNIIDEYRIVDLYVNALRKGSEKQAKYDDAIARLYRVIEMCSSYKLLNYGIRDLSKPNYSNLCKNAKISLKQLSSEFEKIKNTPLPVENLGLDNQMTILGIIDKYDKIHKIYEDMKKELKETKRSLMDKRNRSILAHGTDPLTEKDWVYFRDKVKVIIEHTIGKDKFNDLYEKALHKKIKLT